MKSLFKSLETSPDVSLLNWVTRITRKEFKQTVYLTKGPKRGGNLKISLITVSHMASCNLRNLFLEVWKLAQMYHFLSWVFWVA